jgi:hypothetical protein
MGANVELKLEATSTFLCPVSLSQLDYIVAAFAKFLS